MRQEHITKKRRKNKRIIKITLFFLVITIFIIFIFREKDYQISYRQNDIDITEEYHKSAHIYQFTFKKDGFEYIFMTQHKKFINKKLVKKIDVYEQDDTRCIIAESKKITFYPLCNNGNEQIDYHQVLDLNILPKKYNQEDTSKETEYKNINIYNLNHKTYFIWNYKGFYKLDENENAEINLLKQDTYNIPLTYQINNMLLIADYNQKYNFDTFYLLSKNNNKIKKITSNIEFSFDSYYLGNYKNKVYLVDKKNKKEYEINPKVNTITNITRKNKGKILENNTWKDISINKLINHEYQFTTNKIYTYELQDNTLYQVINNHFIKVSKQTIKDIIKIDNDTVYYLVEDKLYSFNPLEGEQKLLSYFEWNFNYKNMIYIF